MDELKCPHCGSVDMEEEFICYDSDSAFDFNTGEYVVRKYFKGRCTKCGSLLRWEEVYSFTGYQNIVKA